MTRASPATSLGRAAEATVVALAMSGDVAAFTELVHRRQSWLRNLLRRLARDPALADDLAQQVLLQAWRALPKLKSVAAFGAWLRRLAVNAWLAQLRVAPPPAVSMDAREDARELASADTAREGGSAEALDLDRALTRLAPDERLCVVLAYSEGMSHSEISAATGLPLGTVKSHVRRGVEKLRALLRAYQPTGDRVHAAG